MNTKFRREALLSLLVSFITNGTDIVDFFGYVDEEKTFENQNLLAAILSIIFLIAFDIQKVLSIFSIFPISIWKSSVQHKCSPVWFHIVIQRRALQFNWPHIRTTTIWSIFLHWLVVVVFHIDLPGFSILGDQSDCHQGLWCWEKLFVVFFCYKKFGTLFIWDLFYCQYCIGREASEKNTSQTCR